MKYIIAGIYVAIVFSIFLYPYFSNCGIPDELTKEVEELTKEVRRISEKIAERSEE